ncbi:MAG: hypothetical protein BKP49_10880 [Treponema sp. CETP13]|nr:MAG: hypothetical protein BKP49_10880 [Treponema sp. CETP13]
MKKNNFIIMSVLVFMLFFSCTLNYEINSGSLCVRNDCDNNYLRISEVYVMEKERSGYERIWTGNLCSGCSEFIKIEEGKYSVKVVITDAFGFCYELTTGYNIYKNVESEKCVYVMFDGNGVFFE